MKTRSQYLMRCFSISVYLVTILLARVFRDMVFFVAFSVFIRLMKLSESTTCKKSHFILHRAQRDQVRNGVSNLNPHIQYMASILLKLIHLAKCSESVYCTLNRNQHSSLKGLSGQMKQGLNVISIDRYLYQDLLLFIFFEFECAFAL